MAALEGETGGSSLQVALLLAGLAILFLTIYLRRRRPSPDLRPPGSFEEQARDPRRELEQLLADIQDLSRDQIARLDTKIRLLTQLIADCDQRKRELEELLGRLPGGAAAPAPRSANPLHDRVYGLQDAGIDVLEICRQTGLEKGEVELILGLRRVPPPL
jgi:hypothetical protein